MAYFKRQSGESFEAFLRKFKKALKNSKLPEKAKETQVLHEKRNKREQKEYALKSKEIREKKAYLKKIGKLPEDSR